MRPWRGARRGSRRRGRGRSRPASVSMCAASDSSASDPASRPATTSTAMKPAISASARASQRRSASAEGVCVCPAWEWARAWSCPSCARRGVRSAIVPKTVLQLFRESNETALVWVVLAHLWAAEGSVARRRCSGLPAERRRSTLALPFVLPKLCRSPISPVEGSEELVVARDRSDELRPRGRTGDGAGWLVSTRNARGQGLDELRRRIVQRVAFGHRKPSGRLGSWTFSSTSSGVKLVVHSSRMLTRPCARGGLVASSLQSR